MRLSSSFCRAIRPRYFVNCIAVRPERHGSVANRDRLRRHASQRHGRSAEAGGKATASGNATSAEGGKHGFISPDIANRSNAIVNLSRGIGSAGFSFREACQAGEIRQQLQRWLRNKLQNRQCPLGWVQLLVGAMQLHLPRQRVQTHSPTQASRTAWTPNSSWAGTIGEPG